MGISGEAEYPVGRVQGADVALDPIATLARRMLEARD